MVFMRVSFVRAVRSAARARMIAPHLAGVNIWSDQLTTSTGAS
jgi:hypothetical protein